jgi:putative PIN family toxin of toxin-antitoxin system
MAKKVDRLIIDTNLWISFLITKDYKQLDNLLKTGRIKILFSLESLEEILSVVNRSKFKKYFSKADIEELYDLFDFYGETIDVTSIVDLCRDSKDNFLLSLAKDSKADYLITGDKDLLDLKKISKTKIMTITDYLKRIK